MTFTLNNQNLSEFNKKGFTIIKNFLDTKELQKLIEENKNIIKKCELGDWPFLSVYNDYPHFSNKINLFGINFPLNQELSNNIYDLVSKIDVGLYIKKLVPWGGYETTLIRLHVFNKNYNYQGAWHRDDERFETKKSIQSVLYLSDEEGFRIVPKYHNDKLKKYKIALTGEDSSSSYMFRALDPNLYEVISAKKGDIFVFQSGLLHQGFCKKNRLHYHMRHEEIGSTPKTQGLNLSEIYKKNFNVDRIKNIYKGYQQNKTVFAKIRRVKNFIFYFFPRFKYLISNLVKKKFEKNSIFHNTIWQ